jgi:hypothetical protein
MVVPSAPQESELWELIKRGEMPPADSPAGPLSQKQKDTIRDWIAAGAPASTASDAEESVPPAIPPSFEKRLLSWVGAFHLIAVHFPIALLIVAAMAEMWLAYFGQRIPSPTVRFGVWLGAVAAIAAALLGWIYAWSGHGVGMPRVLALHRWLGTAAAIWAIGAVWLLERDERRGHRSLVFRLWLFIGALLVGLTGHFGGVLVHGDVFFGND